VNHHDVPAYHTIGIGAGPANLSLAALFPAAGIGRLALFDGQPGPAWHTGLLYPGVRMQTSWLKDLVSIVDPRHPLTFMNYLVTTGRLFGLMNAQFDTIPRQEYVAYLAWAAQQIDGIHYGVTVDQISYTEREFIVSAGGAAIARAEHLAIGVGTRPVRPQWLDGVPGEAAPIADDLHRYLPGMAADTAVPVAVIGGGQTGLESVLRLLSAGFTDIRWLGRRPWFQTIDDSPAANECYRPTYQRYLQELGREPRRQLVRQLGPTGDAATPGALRVLYQANYDRMLELGRFPITLLPGRDVTGAEQIGDELALHCATAAGSEEHRVRAAVIAVGRENAPIPFDDDLGERVERGEDGDLLIESDNSVRWKGMNGNRIYALSRGRLSHGLADVNLTLLPVRAGLVINSLAGRTVFRILDELSPIQWSRR
jgi:lysine N6-hydroxylase